MRFWDDMDVQRECGFWRYGEAGREPDEDESAGGSGLSSVESSRMAMRAPKHQHVTDTCARPTCVSYVSLENYTPGNPLNSVPQT